MLTLNKFAIVATTTFTKISSTKTSKSTFSPFVKLSIKVLESIKNSKTACWLIILLDTLSIRAVAPDNSPVIFLLCKILVSNVLCNIFTIDWFAGAVIKTIFLDSLRTK